MQAVSRSSESSGCNQLIKANGFAFSHQHLGSINAIKAEERRSANAKMIRVSGMEEGKYCDLTTALEFHLISPQQAP